MKLLSRDLSMDLLATLEERLRARGLLSAQPERSEEVVAVEPRVDPLTFNLRALEEHADATRGLPLHTHRGGLGGTAVLWAKRLFRAGGQLLINEALGRQRLFNGHVRDSYAQLAAEVIQLRKEVAALKEKPRRSGKKGKRQSSKQS